MPQKNKIDRFPAVTAGLLFLSVGLLILFVPRTDFLETAVYVYGNLVYFGVIFCWGIYVERSILSRKIRNLMLTVVCFMVFYMIVRTAKHRIFLDTQFAGRYLWYLYYIPQIFATLLTFIIAFRVGKPEEYKLPKIFTLFYAVGTIIVIGYLTNDVHQLAFRFNPDFVAWDQQYDWGPLFYISTAWIYFWLLAGVVLLTIKSRAINKRKAWIPVFWLMLGSAYIVLANFFHLWEQNPFNLPETHCFIVIAILESAIRIGLMPSNSAYGEIVSKSSAAFQIADYNNNVVYRSENAVMLDSSQMEQAKLGETLIDMNTLLLSNTVSGGNIFWTEDITQVNEMNERLEEIGKSLSEEGDLLQAENEIKEQRAKIAEQTRLYNSVSELVSPQLEKIAGLIDADGDFNKNMAQICVLNCYVKRRANLTLLADRRPFFSSEELHLSIKESSEYLRLCGVISDVYAEKNTDISADVILFCFDLWQNVIENMIAGLSAVMAKISFLNGVYSFRISVDSDTEADLSNEAFLKAEAVGGKLEVKNEDGTAFITFSTEKGGEAL